MSINLLELLQNQMGAGTIGKISGLLETDESTTQKAVGAVSSSLLGGMLTKASTSGGANALFDLFSKGGHDGSALKDVSGLLNGDEKTESLVTQGNGILDMVLGNRLGNIVDMVSSTAGIGKTASSGLLGMMAPLLMGVIGKQVKDQKLDAGGLSSLLMSQQDHLAKAAPSGLANVLGISSFAGIAGDLFGTGKKAVSGTMDAGKNIVGGAADLGGKVVGGTVDAGKNIVGGAADLGGKVVGGTVDAGKNIVGGAADLGGKVVGGIGNAGGKVVGGAADLGGKAVGAAGEAASTGLGWLKALIPLLLLGVIGLFAWQMCGQKVTETAGSVVDTTKNVAGSAVDATKNVAGSAVDATKNVTGAAAGAVGSAVDATKNAAGAAVDATSNAAGAAAGAVGSAVKGMAGFFGLDKLGSWLKDPASKVGQSFLLDKVTFATGSANLAGTSNAQLTEIANILKANPGVHIQLEGHTDNTGNAAKNKTLSQQRANSAMKFLVGKGIDAKRMKAVGFGADKPHTTNDTKEGRAKNRRTEMRITKK